MKDSIILTFFSLVLVCSCTKQSTADKKTVAINLLEEVGNDNARFPMLFASKNRLLMSWTEKPNDSISTIFYSSLKDSIWSKPNMISEGENRFVNWADFPAIAENNGQLLSYSLDKSADGTYTYDIKMKGKMSEASLWSEPFILHNDGTQSEHGFVSMVPSGEDAFFVSWLDGRNTTGGHDHHAAGGMTLRTAFVKSNGQITNELELDAKTCDCCQTSVAMTQNGPVVVYRDRSDDEIRDISIRRFKQGDWTETKRITEDNWKIAGCPVNGPKVVSRDNILAIAWYTAAANLPMVKLIFSEDNGETFANPILLDQVNTIGRVDLDFIDNQTVLMSWISSQADRTSLMCAKVSKNGQIAKVFEVAELDPSRASGFPQLEIYNARAYYAWTEVSMNNTQVRTAYIDLDNL